MVHGHLWYQQQQEGVVLLAVSPQKVHVTLAGMPCAAEGAAHNAAGVLTMGTGPAITQVISACPQCIAFTVCCMLSGSGLSTDVPVQVVTSVADSWPQQQAVQQGM